MPSACSAASSASATGCSSTSARSSGGGRRSGRARARAAPRCGRARRLPRVPRRRDLASRAARPLVAAFVGDAEIRKALRSLPAAPDGHHGYAGGLLEHTVGVATICRETAQLHPRLRTDLLLAAALLHDVGRTRELGRGPAFRPTEEGRLLGHVHLGLRLIEERAAALDAEVRAELLHAVASPPRRARRADRGGGRPLPREPARRGRGHPAGGVSSQSLLALGASVSGGSATSWAGCQRATAARSPFVAVSQVAGLAAVVHVVAALGEAAFPAGGTRTPPRPGSVARSGSPRSTAGWRSARSPSSRRSRRVSAVIPLAVGLATRRAAGRAPARRRRARARRRRLTSYEHGREQGRGRAAGSAWRWSRRSASASTSSSCRPGERESVPVRCSRARGLVAASRSWSPSSTARPCVPAGTCPCWRWSASSTWARTAARARAQRGLVSLVSGARVALPGLTSRARAVVLGRRIAREHRLRRRARPARRRADQARLSRSASTRQHVVRHAWTERSLRCPGRGRRRAAQRHEVRHG